MGDTSKTFTFTATQDAVDNDGEGVRLSFRTLPAGTLCTGDDRPLANSPEVVIAGPNGQSETVTIDNDLDG